jgi:hypothetical protein
MAHYQIKITVQATRLPDPIPIATIDPVKDPMREVAEAMKEQARAIRAPAPFYPGGYRESGVTMQKEVEIVAESFKELSEILGHFDALADQVECSNPAK